MKYSVLVLLLMGALAARAGNAPADSIADRALGEVVVEAKNAMAVTDGIAFLPSQREKKTSMDYVGLLNAMQIPVLNVDLATREVKTNNNQAVAYFINGREAGVMEVRGLRPRDVMKVTVLRSPRDPKYMGKEAVVDFTIQEYEWGGYTSADGRQGFILNEGDYSLYSKFVNGRSTLQASGGVTYRATKGSHTVEHTQMDMLNADGEPWELVSDRYDREDKFRQLNYFAGLKWSYVKPKSYYLTLSAGVRTFSVPVQNSSGQVKYNVDDYADYQTVTHDNSRGTTPYLQFFTQSNLTKALMLQTSLTGSVSLNKNNYDYTASNLPEALVSNTDEKAYSGEVRAQLSYRFPNRSTMTLSVSDNVASYRTHYTGNSGSHQRLVTNEFCAYLSYWLSLAQNWSLKAGVGLPVTYTKANDDKGLNDVLVNGNLTLNGSIGSDHSIYLNVNASRMGRIATAYNDVSVITSQYEGKTGNTTLGLTPTMSGNFSYTWMPRNAFSMSFSTNWHHRFNDYVIGYIPYNNVMYNTLVNSGEYDEVDMYLTATVRLFSRKLSLRPSVWVNHIFHSGIYKVDKWGWEPRLSVNYMPNNHLSFAVSTSCSSMLYSYNKGDGGVVKMPNWSFYLSGTYMLGDFGCQLTVNPFYDYYKMQYTLDGPNIMRDRTEWLTSGGRRFSIAVSYNISYGRKVEHGDEDIVGSYGTSSVR